MRKSQFLLACTAMLIASCAAPSYKKTFATYFDQAERAMAVGDLQTAKVAYFRALTNARLAGDMPPGAEAGLAERLAKVQGNLCEHQEAETTFLQAIAAAEKASGATSPMTFPLRVELAQFTYDTGQYQKAVGYFEQAFSVGEKVLSERQPVAMALLMDDYARALENVGQQTKASDAKEKARALRATGGGSGVVNSGTNYKPYPKTCK